MVRLFIDRRENDLVGQAFLRFEIDFLSLFKQNKDGLQRESYSQEFSLLDERFFLDIYFIQIIVVSSVFRWIRVDQILTKTVHITSSY